LLEVFEPFYTTKAGGMGIGLSLSRSIVEQFGGRIWAENADVGGAIFHFQLPMSSEGVAHRATYHSRR
jgi:signal transduction histidine kinase